MPPIIFNVIQEFVLSTLRTADCGIEGLSGNRRKDLQYTDDICLVTKDIDEMKLMTEIVVAEASRVRLKINARNIEIVKIKNSDKFTYLCCEIMKNL